ncbi:MAG: DNA gyrase C-terminal beta-propeller domain-containing protein [Caldilineaceae bacterium]
MSMVSLERPDVSGVNEEILAYIEALEEALAEAQADAQESSRAARAESALEPSEPPTTMNVISISAHGLAKRTPRHLYLRQRRGGMGIFDLDAGEDDHPAFLTVADESTGLILVTNQGRALRTEVSAIVETEIRGRGQSLLENFPLRPGEMLALVFPDQGGSYLIMVSERGQVRRIGSQYLGKNLQPGTMLYNTNEGGAPAAACWSSGNSELFIVTRQGRAIRFSERQVPVRGCLGLRVEPGDRVVGVAATSEEGGVFLLTEDGKGTIRLMSGFTANKAPGAGGKVAMKTDTLVSAMSVDDGDDIFAISQLGKIIRFQTIEVPAKEGVVQGVNCMNLRSDACMAFTTSTIAQSLP